MFGHQNNLDTLRMKNETMFVFMTLFNGQELNQCLAWSNRASKIQLDAVLKLKNFLSLKLLYNFNVPTFGDF